MASWFKKGGGTPATRKSGESFGGQSVDGTMDQYYSDFRNRVSKFEGLKGFVVQNEKDGVKLQYTVGQTLTWAGVGTIYHIDHEQDQEIHNRVVVIFRTNSDSWSCYGFCKHPSKAECDHWSFKDEHVEVAASAQGQPKRKYSNISIVPCVELCLRDAEGNDLQVESNLWINCRQMLDIKHTVRLASIGSVEEESLKELLTKGRDIFNDTFGDVDKNTSRNTPGSRGAASASPPPQQGLGTSPGGRQERDRKRSKFLEPRSNNPLGFGKR